MTAAPQAIRIHPADDVLVAVRALAAGNEITVEGERIVLAEDIPAGHKIALRPLAPGEPVAMRDYLIRSGIPTEKVIADPSAARLK